jgi:hypothetical protein
VVSADVVVLDELANARGLSLVLNGRSAMCDLRQPRLNGHRKGTSFGGRNWFKDGYKIWRKGMKFCSWATTIVFLVATGLFMSGANALTVAPSGDMRTAPVSADPIHQVRWVCRRGQRCFWVSPRAYHTYGYRRYDLRQACPAEYANRPELCPPSTRVR